jgi:hypothetical protein
MASVSKPPSDIGPKGPDSASGVAPSTLIVAEAPESLGTAVTTSLELLVATEYEVRSDTKGTFSEPLLTDRLESDASVDGGSPTSMLYVFTVTASDAVTVIKIPLSPRVSGIGEEGMPEVKAVACSPKGVTVMVAPGSAVTAVTVVEAKCEAGLTRYPCVDAANDGDSAPAGVDSAERSASFDAALATVGNAKKNPSSTAASAVRTSRFPDRLMNADTPLKLRCG